MSGPVLTIDATHGYVAVGDVPVTGIAHKELQLLCALAQDPTRCFFKEELLRDVWEFKSPGQTRTLDSHACRVRRRLADAGGRFVVNVWGKGYRLVDPGREADVQLRGVHPFDVESALGERVLATCKAMEGLGDALALMSAELRRASRIERERLHTARQSARPHLRRVA